MTEMTRIHDDQEQEPGIIGNFHNRRRIEREAESSQQTAVGRSIPKKIENPDYEVETVGKMLDEKG